jgi:hypothetical protein
MLDYDSTPRAPRSPIHSKDVSEEKGAYESTGWQFTELLSGHISVPSKGDFETGEIEGIGSLSAIAMLLTVDIQKRTRGSSFDHPAQGRSTKEHAPAPYPAAQFHREP